MRNTWQLQQAKNQFSRVVDNALNEGAQIITRHGEPAVVVVSLLEYNKLRSRRKITADVLQACPVKDFGTEPLRDTPRSNPL